MAPTSKKLQKSEALRASRLARALEAAQAVAGTIQPADEARAHLSLCFALPGIVLFVQASEVEEGIEPREPAGDILPTAADEVGFCIFLSLFRLDACCFAGITV